MFTVNCFRFIASIWNHGNWDSSVVQRYATSWMIGVRVPAGTGNFSLHHRVQTGSGAHPSSYAMCTRGSFPGSKAAGA
jgi:hypothetical protein